MSEQIKHYRVELDKLAKLTKALKPFEAGTEENPYACNSWEIEQAHYSLLLAKAWLGKILGELGNASPYHNDGIRKTKEDIEPTADTISGVVWGQEGHLAFITTDPSHQNRKTTLSHIEKVDYLRQNIGEILKNIKPLLNNGPSSMSFLPSYNFEQHLTEARFWLGFELQRIKEEN